ncbi:hypothetical protein [Rhizobium tubonense]|uniref:Lipoprotein n=1 Tax=Rhizobium tubonense TaxID=484088 RepID=A0A2W4EMT4_9HYPH|nr:hypothetical protein [Rhizobium tubonense]PZM15006.1 hypothetical protein CPY51_08100 [Rhizobium tubonense]
MYRFLACGAALAATMALSSCVTNSTGVHAAESHVSVIAGKRTKIDTAFSEKKDCSLRVIPTVHIVEAPKHGSVVIVHETVVPDVKTYRSLRFFPKCNDVPVTGTVAYYTSAPGFVGSERVLTSHSTGEGVRVIHKTIDIDVTK